MSNRLSMSAAGLAVLLTVKAAVAGQLDNGIGATRQHDYSRAFVLLQPLARRGNAIAQFNLALMYDEGNGVPQNYAKAFRWYLRAAENGLVQAQYAAGYYYAWGRGMKQDVVRAHMWLNIAAANGLAHADVERDNEQSHMTRAQIREAQRLAAAWQARHPYRLTCSPRQCARPSWLPKADWYSPFYWRGL
jgi:hypothetical protein